MTICFLSGSGVSTPAGVPGTEDITEFIFDCKKCFRHTNETYVFSTYPRSGQKLYTKPIPIIKRFLQFLKDEASQYYKDSKTVNYEDLFYLVNQIADADSRSKEYDNPAIQPLINKIPKEILESWEKIQREIGMTLELFKETKRYIMDAVYYKLSSVTSKNANYLNLFVDAANDKRVSVLDIFSLNHDLLLEQYFIKNKINIIDGFTLPDENKIRYWQPNLYEQNEPKLRLYKLHGSINWCRVRSEDNITWPRDQIIIAPDPEHAKDKKGNWLTLLDKRLFLIGTFNKMLEYTTRDIFLQLLCIFRQRLHNSSRLIVSGYSFGDKGINSVLLNWVFSNKNNLLLVVHPNPSLLRRNVRGAIFNNWSRLVKNKTLRFINKCFQKTSWNDIANELWD